MMTKGFPPPLLRLKGFPKACIERNVTRNYIRLQEKNTVRCLKMRVLQMLQMLQRFFALATHKGKFETEEDFADTIVPCYDWIA